MHLQTTSYNIPQQPHQEQQLYLYRSGFTILDTDEMLKTGRENNAAFGILGKIYGIFKWSFRLSTNGTTQRQTTHKNNTQQHRTERRINLQPLTETMMMMTMTMLIVWL